MTFTQLQSEVRTRLNEASANFWANTDINTSINDGYAELSDASEWKESSASVATTANVTYYSLLTMTSDEILSLRSAQNPTTKYWLQPADALYMDSQVHPRWENITSEPEYYLMRGLFQVGYTPKRNASGTILQFYSMMPAALSAGTDTPGFPQEFHFGIVEYALYDLLAQEGETDKSLTHWEQYLGYEKSLVEYVNSRIGHPRVETLHRG
jgi:hypothetical protein